MARSTQFFHGSTSHLQPGDVIHPAVATGVEHHDLASWRKKHVWVTDNESAAWDYADLSQHGVSYPGGTDTRTQRRVVYEVEPQGEPVRKRRLSARDPKGKEFIVPSAVVKRRIEGPLPSYQPHYGARSEWRQGAERYGQQTLPQAADWQTTYELPMGQRVEKAYAPGGKIDQYEASYAEAHRTLALERLEKRGLYNRRSRPTLF